VVFDGTELDAGDTKGFIAGKTSAFEVFGAEFDVSVEFEVDGALDGVATKKGVEVGAKLGPHG
jgi:hypothetical protein